MGGLITDVRPSRVRLPAFFSNLLPEGALRAYLAERAGVKESREFALLAVLGQDLPGAITVRPAGAAAWGLVDADADILTGNGDMHLKNWSLIYPDRRTPALSPGYDFVSTIPYIPDDTLALKFGKSKRMELPSRDQLSHFAARARLPERLVLRTAAETVDSFRTVWPEESRALPPTALAALEAHVSRVPF